MKEFFDTSVLVAAFRREHVHHVPSLKRFAAAEKRHSACGLHSLAEVFSVMTTLPVKPMIPPEQALLFVEEIRNRLTLVSLERRLRRFHRRPRLRFFTLGLRRQMQSPGRLHLESQALPVPRPRPCSSHPNPLTRTRSPMDHQLVLYFLQLSTLNF